MTKRFLPLAPVLLIAILVLGLVSSPRPAEAEPLSAEAVNELFGLVNQERAAAGLPPVRQRDDVMAIAGRFAEQLAREGSLRHNDDYFTKESLERLDAERLGENVAYNESVSAAHRALMQSPPHRANILQPEFSVIGIGVSVDPAGTVYVTENFVAPSNRPAPSASEARPDRRPSRTAAAAPMRPPAAQQRRPAPVAAAPSSTSSTSTTATTAPLVMSPVAVATPAPDAGGAPEGTSAPEGPPIATEIGDDESVSVPAVPADPGSGYRLLVAVAGAVALRAMWGSRHRRAGGRGRSPVRYPHALRHTGSGLAR